MKEEKWLDLQKYKQSQSYEDFIVLRKYKGWSCLDFNSARHQEYIYEVAQATENLWGGN